MTGLGRLGAIARESSEFELKPVLVQTAAAADGLSEVLTAIREAFYAHAEEVERLKTNMSEEHWDWFEESQQAVKHGLFGAAFVTCQAYINALTQAVKHFSDHLGSAGGSMTMTLPSKPHELHRLGNRREIAAIHHLANYFKHVEEWSDQWWEEPSTIPDRKPARHTIIFLKNELEMKDRHARFLEEGAKKLLIPAGQCISELCRYYREWSDDVVATARMAAGKGPHHLRAAPPEPSPDS